VQSLPPGGWLIDRLQEPVSKTPLPVRTERKAAKRATHSRHLCAQQGKGFSRGVGYRRVRNGRRLLRDDGRSTRVENYSLWPLTICFYPDYRLVRFPTGDALSWSHRHVPVCDEQYRQKKAADKSYVATDRHPIHHSFLKATKVSLKELGRKVAILIVPYATAGIFSNAVTSG
jgi:hypothetical protein